MSAEAWLAALNWLGQAVCVGMTAWLSSDDYHQREQARAALYAVSQTGWRGPIEHALKSDDTNTVAVARQVQKELANVTPGQELPSIANIDPPAQVRHIYLYWRLQYSIQYNDYTTNQHYTYEILQATARDMTACFINDSIRHGLPPAALIDCLAKAKEKEKQ